MDATQRVFCRDDLFNPLTSMGLQASLILSISHLIQIVLKPVGQPSPIAQLVAGTLLGHSFLSRIPAVDAYFYQNSSADYYEVLAFFSRICFMFLIGLELDFYFLKRHLRTSIILAYSGFLVCTIFAAAISYPGYKYFAWTEDSGQNVPVQFFFVLMVSLSNSASPLVFRFAAELNIANSEFGRLAMCTSMITDVTSLLFGIVVTATINKDDPKIGGTFFTFLLTGIVCFLMRYLISWLNSRSYKFLKNAKITLVFVIVLFIAGVGEVLGGNSLLVAFILGATFPREGKTARTLLRKLSYAIYTFILPIYFGYTGVQANLKVIGQWPSLVAVVVVISLSTGGKILGTLAACHKLKIPRNEGIALALLLNLKGHFDLLILARARENLGWRADFFDVMLVTVLLNTLICGVTVSLIVAKSYHAFGYKPMPLEWQSPETELRVLACVYGPRHVNTMLRLVGGLGWSKDLPITAYLMHLVELLHRKRSSGKMYNQLEDDELSDDEAYGGNDALEISEAVDAFVSETRVFIHQIKAVSPLSSIFEDVCDGGRELRASIIVLPFHKHQRIDGKMESGGKEGLRTTNQRVLRHAPCTVGILVDRGLVGGSSQAQSSYAMQHVAVLFFGGPDDREALSFSKRIAMDLHVNLTVIRFMLSSSRGSNEKINVLLQDNDQVLMAMPGRGTEDDADSAFLEDFYSRYVTVGQVGYIEKYVENGTQTVTALKDIGDMYQLFIVGKGGRRNSPLTTGLSDWEECPEIGTVGDLLASSEFLTNSSVLIIQQHKPLAD